MIMEERIFDLDLVNCFCTGVAVGGSSFIFIFISHASVTQDIVR